MRGPRFLACHAPAVVPSLSHKSVPYARKNNMMRLPLILYDLYRFFPGTPSIPQAKLANVVRHARIMIHPVLQITNRRRLFRRTTVITTYDRDS